MAEMFQKEQLEKVHKATVAVLEKTGMRFLHPTALELFRKNGIRTEGDTVFFTEEQLLYWVGKAPSGFRVYARNPKYDMYVGGDEVNVMLGTGAAQISDLDGNTRTANTGDFIRLVKLYEQNPDNKSNGGGVVQAQDVNPRHRMTTAAFGALLYSEKVLEAESIEDNHSGMADGEEFIELLKIAYDATEEELRAKPRCIAITNTNSPLIFDKKMLEMLFFCAKYGQPVCISACSMAGTTGPVTLAGNIVLTNAEVLAGVALSQMYREGTPVVYGCQSTIADMRDASISIGAAESGLTYALGAAMAKYYHLPSRGGGAHTDASAISAQSGYESMLTLMATYGAKTNLIFHSSGIMHSYASMSFEKLVIDFEIVSMIKRFYQGVSFDEEDLAVEAICEIGIGGAFVACDHTLENMRKEVFYPKISVRNCRGSDYSQKFVRGIYNRIDSMLAAYQRPALDPAKISAMKNYLISIGVDRELLTKIECDAF